MRRSSDMVSNRQRFERASRDYYGGKITAQEYHRIAIETGHEWDSVQDAIDRMARNAITRTDHITAAVLIVTVTLVLFWALLEVFA